jgi:predicted kinase
VSPTLHLVCGLPCSGKTTLAKRLEREERALRLTPDEWHTRLFGQDSEDQEHDERHDTIEALLWEVASRSLELGIDVILDFGFWSRTERDDYRSRARAIGAASQLHYLDVPEPVLLDRLVERNRILPDGAFKISPWQLKEWAQTFEPPAEDEFT